MSTGQSVQAIWVSGMSDVFQDVRPDIVRINFISLVAKSGGFYSDLRNKGSSVTCVLIDSASTVE